MSSIGKIGVRSGWRAGAIVCGFAVAAALPAGREGRFTQYAGMASSERRYFVVSP